VGKKEVSGVGVNKTKSKHWWSSREFKYWYRDNKANVGRYERQKKWFEFFYRSKHSEIVCMVVACFENLGVSIGKLRSAIESDTELADRLLAIISKLEEFFKPGHSAFLLRFFDVDVGGKKIKIRKFVYRFFRKKGKRGKKIPHFYVWVKSDLNCYRVHMLCNVDFSAPEYRRGYKIFCFKRIWYHINGVEVDGKELERVRKPVYPPEDPNEKYFFGGSREFSGIFKEIRAVAKIIKKLK
jgi:hypothetical protein